MSDTPKRTPWVIVAIGKELYIESDSPDCEETRFVADMQLSDCETEEEKHRALANAAFIVRACNSHEELLAACRGMVGWLEMIEEEEGTKFLGLSVDAMKSAIANASACGPAGKEA